MPNTLNIPSRNSVYLALRGIPTPEQESLQAPLIDPTWALGAGILGGPMAAIKDVAQQGVFGALAKSILNPSQYNVPPAPEVGKLDPTYPKLMEEDWFRPRAKSRFPITTSLIAQARRAYTDMLTREQAKFLTQTEPFPEYHSKIQGLYPVGENVPKPEDLVYHGLSTDLGYEPEYATEKALKRLESIQQTGLNSGWFAEHPHEPFGPLFVATELPKGYKARRGGGIDPNIEILPSGGRPTKIPPEKLWLVDHKGNLLGRLGGGPSEGMLKEWGQSVQNEPSSSSIKPLTGAQTYAIASRHNIPWTQVDDWALFNKVPQDKYKEIINSENIIETMKKFLTKVKE